MSQRYFAYEHFFLFVKTPAAGIDVGKSSIAPAPDSKDQASPERHDDSRGKKRRKVTKLKVEGGVRMILMNSRWHSLEGNVSSESCVCLINHCCVGGRTCMMAAAPLRSLIPGGVIC